MLARRLLVFALVLLVVTSISTSLAPPPRDVSPAPSAPGSTSSSTSSTVEQTIRTSREDPPTIAVEQGDILRLTVEAEETGSVELRDLGQVKAIAPLTDVVFDVLPSVPGEYPVIFETVDDERTVGTVRVVSPEE